MTIFTRNGMEWGLGYCRGEKCTNRFHVFCGRRECKNCPILLTFGFSLVFPNKDNYDKEFYLTSGEFLLLDNEEQI